MRTLFYCLLFLLSLPVAAQDVSTFDITIERTKDGFRATCTEGCAWKEVQTGNALVNKFELDTYGVSDEVSVDGKNKAPFVLVLDNKHPGKLVLWGKQGTAWGELTFTMKVGDQQRVNQFGMAK